MQKISTKKKGFSLIELAIVLVIIGIMVVGISSGRSLIKSAKVSAARSATLSTQIVSIPGMIAWFESSTKDSFRRSESVDESQITTWFNIAPSGFLFRNNLGVFGDPVTGAVVGNVSYEYEGINDIPAVRFVENSNISLNEFAASPLPESTLIIVFQNDIGTDDAQAVLSAGNNQSIEHDFLGNVPYILMVNFNGVNSAAYINNTSPLPTFDVGTNLLDGVLIGSLSPIDQGLTGEISEVIIYNTSLSATQREDVFNYLSDKYKITVSGL